MSERERRRLHDDDPSGGQGPDRPDGPDTEPLARQRREVDELLRAGDEIISRVISGDSAAFLTAGQQQGGQ